MLPRLVDVVRQVLGTYFEAKVISMWDKSNGRQSTALYATNHKYLYLPKFSVYRPYNCFAMDKHRKTHPGMLNPCICTGLSS